MSAALAGFQKPMGPALEFPETGSDEADEDCPVPSKTSVDFHSLTVGRKVVLRDALSSSRHARC